MSVPDQTDSVFSLSKEKIQSFDYIEYKDPLAPNTMAARVSQQTVLPNSVQQRLLGQIITSNPASNSLGSGIQIPIVLVNNTTSITTIKVSNNLGKTIIAIPDISLYTSQTVLSNATQWPGNGFGLSNMIMTVMNDWGTTNNVNVTTRVLIRNTSGADAPSTIVYRYRIITNPIGGTGISNL